jgi:hypothetical protein
VLQQDRLLGWNLLQNSQRLRINTIDSFTSWLTARLPLRAGFGARPSISTDMKALFEEAVRLTLDSLEDSDASADQVASLLRHQHGKMSTPAQGKHTPLSAMEVRQLLDEHCEAESFQKLISKRDSQLLHPKLLRSLGPSKYV